MCRTLASHTLTSFWFRIPSVQIICFAFILIEFDIQSRISQGKMAGEIDNKNNGLETCSKIDKLGFGLKTSQPYNWQTVRIVCVRGHEVNYTSHTTYGKRKIICNLQNWLVANMHGSPLVSNRRPMKRNHCLSCTEMYRVKNEGKIGSNDRRCRQIIMTMTNSISAAAAYHQLYNLLTIHSTIATFFFQFVQSSVCVCVCFVHVFSFFSLFLLIIMCIFNRHSAHFSLNLSRSVLLKIIIRDSK